MTRLPVLRILRDTFQIPVRHFREFATPLALPALLVAVLCVGWQLTRTGMPEMMSWVTYAIYGAAFTIFAVSCHRLVLLGPSPDTLVPRLRWGLRESKFFAWLVLFVLLFFGVRLTLLLVSMNLLTLSLYSAGVEPSRFLSVAWFRGFDYLSYAITFYLTARFSLILPATAIDAKVGLRWAWKQSARNGLRLALIVGALPWVLTYAVSFATPEDPALPELIIAVILTVFALMFEIVALSLSYHDLSAQSAPPSPDAP
jgi:hypothetical protein